MTLDERVKDWYEKYWCNHPWQKGYSDIDGFINLAKEKINQNK